MKENISAFMDGELEGRAASQAMNALAQDRDALQAWRAYHVIRDALHDNPPLSTGFSARVAEALAKEPTVLAPQRVRRVPHTARPRAWYAVAASVAAVAFVAWMGLAPQQDHAVVAKAPLAQPAPMLPQQTFNVVPPPSGTNDYLLAHQAVSPRLSLQGMAPYVRSVSEPIQEPRR